MVPFLYLFYTHPALAGVSPGPEVATLAAHATSLAVILPTSLLGTWRFQRQGMVVWEAAVPIGIAAAAAAVLGSRVAALSDPRLLRLGFGVLLLFSAWRLLRSRPAPAAAAEAPAPPPRALRLSLPVTTGVGGVMGFFSALLGVGGGIVGIPLLLGVVRVGLRQVAATSMAIITLTSLAGAAAYMLAAPPAAVRPGWSAGFVDLPVALAMSAGTLLSVALGAELNRRLDARALAVVFAAVFAAAGTRLVVGNL
jgi:uncharacterized membrane protein YfcA